MAATAVRMLVAAAIGQASISCDIDGLWHGGGTTASIKSSSGPQGAPFRATQALPARPTHPHTTATTPKGYVETDHAAVGCSGSGCLNAPGHGCRTVKSGAYDQCVWEGGVDPAAAGCDAWDECEAFWCGAATDVPASNASWCWARRGTDVLHAGAFANATAFVKANLPLGVELKCTAGCGWVWAAGEWNRGTGDLHVTYDNGQGARGVVDANCSTISWDGQPAWSNEMLKIKKVHVVYMAHFDVGYTSPNVKQLLDVYATQYFPKAWNTSAEMRRLYPDRPDLQYKWTSHPWLLDALLQNQTGGVAPGFPAVLDQAIRRGDVLYHANPMNVQSEAGELVNMDAGMTEAARLDAQYGQARKIAASQKDEPGATLGMVGMFARHGVRMLHIGANDFSTVPALPSVSPAYHGFCNPFLWSDSELPAGSELLTLYCSGYSGPYEDGIEAPNMMAVIPGFDEALVYLMHVDNRGPQSVANVLEGINATHRTFPNAEVLPSSMDAWTAAALVAAPALPNTSLPRVTDAEPGSTWVQGVGTDPYKMRRYRAVARAAAAAAASGSVNTSDPSYVLFQDLLLKEPEHTWGVSSGCEGDYTDKQFHDPGYACHIGSAAFNVTVQSYTDQRQFVDRAVAALGDLPLRAECEAALNASDPAPPDVSGLTPLALGQLGRPVALPGGVTVTFNASGAIVGLARAGGRASLASPAHPLGLFSYARHSGAELDRWGSTYGLGACASACGHCAFSKCGYPPNVVSAVTAATVTAAWADAKRGVFVFNLTFGSDGALDSPLYGAPPFATLQATVAASPSDSASVSVALDLCWFGKPPTRLAESLWLTVSPGVYPRDGWEMHKLGRWVDPLSVPVNGSRTRHAVWTGVRHASAGGGFDAEVNTTDAPLVVVGPNVYDPNGAVGAGVEAHPEEGWAFNLYNNAWATNFPAFSIDANARFRFSLRLR